MTRFEAGAFTARSRALVRHRVVLMTRVLAHAFEILGAD